MPETAENVATEFHIEREAQDRMALASQLKAVAAQKAGHLARDHAGGHAAEEGRPGGGDADEHPRETSWRRWPGSRAWCARTAR
jgi:acetyl-CoA acyltransferase